MPSDSDLNLAIATYEKLISNYERARERLLERRRSATDAVMVELDDGLAANQQTIDSLRRSVEISHEHLKLLGCEPRATEFPPSPSSRPFTFSHQLSSSAADAGAGRSASAA